MALPDSLRPRARLGSALGAASGGAFAAGALAGGAVAIGAMAIGRLAIGRLRVGRVSAGGDELRDAPGRRARGRAAVRRSADRRRHSLATQPVTSPLPGETIGEDSMASVRSDLENVLVGERENWQDGPPHELFAQLRGQCPVHWTSRATEYPEAPGYWSVTTAEDIHTVSRDWQTYSSATGITAINAVFPLELTQAMFIGMDPPKHDRLKALFQAGFTPRRIADHEEAIRAIAVKVLDRPRGPRELRPGRGRRPADRLAGDRQLHGHPRGGRCDLGAADELRAQRRRRGPQPRTAPRRSANETSPRSSSDAAS